MAIHFLILKMLWSMSCLLDPKTFLLEIIFPNLASHIQGFWVKNVWKVSNPAFLESDFSQWDLWRTPDSCKLWTIWHVWVEKKVLVGNSFLPHIFILPILVLFWAIYKWSFKKHMEMLPNKVSVLFFL